MVPLVKEPTTKPGGIVPAELGKTADDDIELEVFELDEEQEANGDDEELLLLEEEASDPGPGTKKP